MVMKKEAWHHNTGTCKNISPNTPTLSPVDSAGERGSGLPPIRVTTFLEGMFHDPSLLSCVLSPVYEQSISSDDIAVPISAVL